MRDHPAVIRYARSFSRHPELEHDDLMQVGRLAIWRAERAIGTGQYDPRISSWDTYATNCVYKAMCRELAERRRERALQVVSLGEEASIDELADGHGLPPDGRLFLHDLLRELPDDARAVVELVIGDEAGDLVDAALSGARGATARLRSYVRRSLGLRRGDRAAAAFGAIAAALGGD